MSARLMNFGVATKPLRLQREEGPWAGGEEVFGLSLRETSSTESPLSLSINWSAAAGIAALAVQRIAADESDHSAAAPGRRVLDLSGLRVQCESRARGSEILEAHSWCARAF